MPVFETRTYIFPVDRIAAVQLFAKKSRVYCEGYGAYIVLDQAETEMVLAMVRQAGFLELSNVIINPAKITVIKKGIIWEIDLAGVETTFPTSQKEDLDQLEKYFLPDNTPATNTGFLTLETALSSDNVTVEELPAQAKRTRRKAGAA